MRIFCLLQPSRTFAVKYPQTTKNESVPDWGECDIGGEEQEESDESEEGNDEGRQVQTGLRGVGGGAVGRGGGAVTGD